MGIKTNKYISEQNRQSPELDPNVLTTYFKQRYEISSAEKGQFFSTNETATIGYSYA